MKWIDVKEQLPQEGQAVLVFQTYPKGTMFNCLQYPLCRCNYVVAEFGWKNEFYYSGTGMNTVKHVSHWMPLPEEPKEQSCTS